ncbi:MULTISPECIES: phage tail protein [unclassified Burkholderia]|uniref:phage tail protein n=1 Tax=unclassified Burkholderia TaxID=2613784 RepID=UPI000F579C75|nr:MULTISPECIES: phage tail protein [unclassified Burkholderia]RQR38943.1 phage tail protein [Burkholderia sp. Bp9131]RQR69192.1 phage tail protein [Burkholderia sp. Bp9015]RQR93431.1 phage tail protein [Burkholderia sp. Bp8994]RQS27139.1 phage tail protein [Burkholderia sp. Bp8995]RQS37754.1 phage tail protein [Burkholderia sp. Bp8990]
MSAPENSNSKTPPSLLSDTKPAGGGEPQQSRILANLEGRVTPPAEPPRRSLKGPIAAVVALVVAVGGWGAWRWQQQSGEAAVVAAAPVQAPAKAEPASAAAVQVAQNAASAAPVVQTATIVNDDAASQVVASASGASGADNSRLSRALANGADDASGAATAGAVAATAAAAAATTKSAKADATKSDKVAARSKADAKADAKAEARKHHKEQQAELAQAKKRREATTRSASAKASGKDDPDADLLAALVARTKPADKKVAAQKGQVVPTKTAAATGGSLASRVKDCAERGFFEDQLCRWRVCDGHWGKDPACPTAAQSETRQ